MKKLSSTLLAVAALAQQASAAEKESLPVLTNAQQVLLLGRAEPRLRTRLVDFETVITLPSMSSPRGYWTQDGTNALWVVPTNAFVSRAGLRVKIKGVSAVGNSVPVFVEKANLEVLGPAAMPEPLRLPVTHLFRPEFFGRWIEQEGAVNNVDARGTWYQ